MWVISTRPLEMQKGQDGIQSRLLFLYFSISIEMGSGNIKPAFEIAEPNQDSSGLRVYSKNILTFS